MLEIGLKFEGDKQFALGFFFDMLVFGFPLSYWNICLFMQT